MFDLIILVGVCFFAYVFIATILKECAEAIDNWLTAWRNKKNQKPEKEYDYSNDHVYCEKSWPIWEE